MTEIRKRDWNGNGYGIGNGSSCVDLLSIVGINTTTETLPDGSQRFVHSENAEKKIEKRINPNFASVKKREEEISHELPRLTPTLELRKEILDYKNKLQMWVRIFHVYFKISFVILSS